jgi:aminoglycoside phosphotransferase (APT) family kinase protein
VLEAEHVFVHSILGTPFYLMEFLDGRILRDPKLPELTREERGVYIDEVVRTLVAIHKADWKGRGLRGYGKEGR